MLALTSIFDAYAYGRERGGVTRWHHAESARALSLTPCVIK
jgi:hypothetical protein